MLSFGIACATCAEQIRSLTRAMRPLQGVQRTAAVQSDFYFLWLMTCSAAGEFIKTLRTGNNGSTVDKFVRFASEDTQGAIAAIRTGKKSEHDRLLIHIRGKHIGHWDPRSIRDGLSTFGGIDNWPPLSETHGGLTNEDVASPITYRVIMGDILSRTGDTEEETLSMLEAITDRTKEIADIASESSVACVKAAGYGLVGSVRDDTSSGGPKSVPDQ